jgi:hypothetical protein
MPAALAAEQRFGSDDGLGAADRVPAFGASKDTLSEVSYRPIGVAVVWRRSRPAGVHVKMKPKI